MNGTLTHWGRVTHICVSNLPNIGQDNGLSPGWRLAIIWTNTEILLIWTLATNFSEILSEINTFSFKKMRLNMSSAKSRPFCLGPNVLKGVWSNIKHRSPLLSHKRQKAVQDIWEIHYKKYVNCLVFLWANTKFLISYWIILPSLGKHALVPNTKKSILNKSMNKTWL